MEHVSPYFSAGFYATAGVFAAYAIVLVLVMAGCLLYLSGFFGGLWKFVKGFFGFVWAVLRWLVT